MFGGLFSGGSSSSNSKSLDGDQTKALHELIENMVRGLVDEPEKINLKMVDGDDGLVFELRVSKVDLGKVIGKKGRTASAMRTILSAASRKHKVGADLRIVE
ncbi:MAG: KH domain-containing protein [Deltaproteobacteria bacterium]|nr:KH domain-containing protein [Deltaproteobacteria bacterium]